MEKIIKGISIILITFLVILQGTIISNADNTQSDEENAVTKISLKVKKSKITPNSEIKVYIYLESTKQADGIAVVEGKIDFDADKLEPITTNDSTYNGWTTTWNTENGSITIDRGNLTSTPQEIAELTFKVKEEVEAGDTNVAFKEISVSDGFEDETIEESANLKLTISNADNSGNNDNKDDNNNDNKNDDNKNNNKDDNKNDPSNNGSDNNNSNNNSNNSSNNNNSNQEQKGNTINNSNTQNTNKNITSVLGENNSKTTNGSLPKTGVTQWLYVLGGVLIAAGIVSYIKYNKYKNI